jgi:hypothetical protein
MRTYYRGPDAVVTDTHFVWKDAVVRIFAIDDLADVRLERRAPGGRSGLELVLVLALLATAVLAGWRFGLLVAAPPVVAAALVLIVLRRRGRPAWEIRARYRAREVTLYTSRDPRIFNQVTRALRRTIERRGVRRAHGLVSR